MEDVWRNQPKRLRENHRLGLWLMVRGLSTKKAAQHIGLSHGRLKHVACSPLGRAYLQAANIEWSQHRYRCSMMLALGYSRDEALRVLLQPPDMETSTIIEAITQRLAHSKPQTVGELLAILDGVRRL